MNKATNKATSKATSKASAKPVRKPLAGDVKILIVDDHPIVRRGLAELIQSEPQFKVCGEAANAAEAIKLIDQQKPDLAVVDIALDGTDGIELIKQIKAWNDTLKVLVSSMHDESLYAERALYAGARGYINKAEATDRIVEAIHQVLAGKVYLSPTMTERLLHRVAGGDEQLEKSPVDRLSDRELEVFRLIGEGFTTRQIAERLHLSTKTIETYRDHIKTKLNLANNTQLIRQAVQWVLEDRDGKSSIGSPQPVPQG